jgi:hypothetical protein
VLNLRPAQWPGDVKGEGTAALSEGVDTFLDAGPIAATGYPGGGTHIVAGKGCEGNNSQGGNNTRKTEKRRHAAPDRPLKNNIYYKNNINDKNNIFCLTCACRLQRPSHVCVQTFIKGGL